MARHRSGSTMASSNRTTDSCCRDQWAESFRINSLNSYSEHRGLPCYCQLLLSSCLARAKLSFWPLPTHTRTRALELASRGSALVLLRRKAKYGGMDVPEAKLLKHVEEENAKLKKLLAEH